MQIYCQARGIAPPDANTYSFCMALSLFRMAAICAGVGARALMGNASSSRAAEVSFYALHENPRIATPYSNTLACLKQEGNWKVLNILEPPLNHPPFKQDFCAW